MNDGQEIFRQIYKPYRVTKKNNVTIYETTSGNYVIKKKTRKDIKSLYNYLRSRSFTNYPRLIDNTRDDYNVFEYVEEVDTPNEQKSLDMIKIVANLHSKTTYFKEVSLADYQEIYENIKDNIISLREYYTTLLITADETIYMAPSVQMFAENSSKIFSSLDYCENVLDDWFDLIREKKKERVAVIHNNLELSHYIKNEEDYLISWDNSKIDSPILDLINLYKKEYLNIDFSEVLKSYMEMYPLSNDEKTLLFVVLALPPKFTNKGIEIKKCQEIGTILDYIYKTEELIRPYYTEENKE